jgi:hypothetical protein
MIVLTLYLDKVNVDEEDCGLSDSTVDSLNWYSSDVWAGIAKSV